MKKLFITLLVLFVLATAGCNDAEPSPVETQHAMSGYVRNLRYDDVHECCGAFTEFTFEHDNGKLQRLVFEGHLPIWPGMYAKISYIHTTAVNRFPDRLVTLERDRSKE